MVRGSGEDTARASILVPRTGSFKVNTWRIMVAAIIFTVAFTYMVGYVGFCFGVYVTSKGVFLLAIWAGVTAATAVVRFKCIAVHGGCKLIKRHCER